MFEIEKMGALAQATVTTQSVENEHETLFIDKFWSLTIPYMYIMHFVYCPIPCPIFKSKPGTLRAYMNVQCVSSLSFFNSACVFSV